MKVSNSLEQELMFYLRKAVALSDRVGDRLFRKVAGITKIQYILLLTLEQTSNPRITQQEIARTLSVTKGAVSRQIVLAQQAGLIKVTPSPESRRENHLSVTPQGRQALKAAQAANTKLAKARPDRISDDDLSVTTRTLRKLCEALDELEAEIQQRNK